MMGVMGYGDVLHAAAVGSDIYVDENGRERNDMMSWRMRNARTLVLGNV